jgi:virginiamycin B lyase
MRRHRIAILVVSAPLIVLCVLATAQQTANPELNVPYSTLKPAAQFLIGTNADWVAIGADSVWVAGKGPHTLRRIDPRTNTVIVKVSLPGEACSGLAIGFGSVWIPLCGQTNSLVRLDITTNRLTNLNIGPAREESGITVSDDSVWLVSDDLGTLNRIDPHTNRVRQRISISAGSYNPIYSSGKIWVTCVKSNTLTAVDAHSGAVIATIPVGPEPRFLTAGAGSVWTLNQADGTITRIDEAALKVVATIHAGIPGQGGDIAFGEGSVWATRFGTPLTRINPQSNTIQRQWVGPGGDSLRLGFGSIWITDYRQGLLLRIPMEQATSASN